VVESGGLENRCVGNPCTEGSNPSPSAFLLQDSTWHPMRAPRTVKFAQLLDTAIANADDPPRYARASTTVRLRLDVRDTRVTATIPLPGQLRPGSGSVGIRAGLAGRVVLRSRR
jgi:hypothetical protein